MDHYDLTIIGAGSGNSIPDTGFDARYGAMRIAICEEDTFGGTCLNVGCIPTKSFVYTADVAQTVSASARFGVDATLDKVRWTDIVTRVFGRIDPIAANGERYRRSLPNLHVYASHTTFAPTQPDGRYTLRTDAGEVFTSDKVVIAAGSRTRIPPAITDSGVAYQTSDTIMRIPALPEHLTIVGGGFVAAEFAHVFSALGVRISIVVRGRGMLKNCDDSICHRFTAMAADKWELHTDKNIAGAHRDSEHTVLEFDDGSTLSADILLIATGRVPNGDLLDAKLAGVDVDDTGLVIVDDYQRTTARGIFALGDVSSAYQLKHVANHEMRVVRHNLLLDWDDTAAMRETDHRFIPSAVFTHPQIATVGMTEQQAQAAGFDLITKEQKYGDTAYGWAMEDEHGFVKLISDRATGKILGAHIMGYQASSLIQPLVQAMTFGQTAKDVAEQQYWIHPALPEVIENALLGIADRR
ncbi:mycothione reductase [Mycolicibacterium sp. CBMA 226]|uniref:mycothione reductase n=1 Tax=Mycolicibacterium sp. CBMA 226 TaxID=2606611 RepID=UPI0012DD2E4C|nr:mycothione reductase [Mycolicibacterium sp. CBMA 226]MUL77025.1 mycothione reductase [Mycolicibacterium sp. CBMA 226]